MLRLFERLLGPNFWKHVVIVFTHVDEEQRGYLEQNIDALTDPAEGFVRVLGQWFNLPYQPPLVFLSNKDTRYSQYARDCFMELYEAVVSVEEGARRAKFTCTFFQEVNNRVSLIVYAYEQEGRMGWMGRTRMSAMKVPWDFIR